MPMSILTGFMWSTHRESPRVPGGRRGIGRESRLCRRRASPAHRWAAVQDAGCRLAVRLRQGPECAGRQRADFATLRQAGIDRRSRLPGIWLECGPHEALVYRKFRPDVARQSQQCFFALQRADGQFPYSNKASGTGFGQIQMAVPIAATAWELAQTTGDEELLHQAYEACAKWDAWLLRYRNTRGTGLTEGFCTYDTGEDNSPRWHGIPAQCPDQDARKFAPDSSCRGFARTCQPPPTAHAWPWQRWPKRWQNCRRGTLAAAVTGAASPDPQASLQRGRRGVLRCRCQRGFRQDTLRCPEPCVRRAGARPAHLREAVVASVA